jgi:transcription factor C subunit 7
VTERSAYPKISILNYQQVLTCRTLSIQFRTGWQVNPVTGEYTSNIRSPTGIAADPPLTSHGVQQAEELGRHLATLDPPIDVVFSSPYYRCLQTIAPFINTTRGKLGLDRSGNDIDPSRAAAGSIRPEMGISEWFGAAPFKHPRPAPAAILKPMFPAYDDEYESAEIPSGNGETLTQLYERVGRAVGSLIERCDAEGKRAAVLCSHAAVIIVLGRVLTGNVPLEPDVQDFNAFTCGLSVFRRQAKGTSDHLDAPTPSVSPSQKAGMSTPSYILAAAPLPVNRNISANISAAIGGWTCEVNGDCSFLSSGAERNW